MKIPDKVTRLEMIQGGYNPLNEEDQKRYYAGQPPLQVMGQKQLVNESFEGVVYSETEANPEDVGRTADIQDILELKANPFKETQRQQPFIPKRTVKQKPITTENIDFGFEDEDEEEIDPQAVVNLYIDSLKKMTAHFQAPSYKTRVAWTKALLEVDNVLESLKSNTAVLKIVNSQLIKIEAAYWKKLRK